MLSGPGPRASTRCCINPDLVVQRGDSVQLTIIDGDGISHDLGVPDLNMHSGMLMSKGDKTEVVFEVKDAGTFAYYCTVSGHRQTGWKAS